jgi:hypothetical protein
MMTPSDTQPAVLNVPEIRHPSGSRQRNRVAFYWNPTQTRGLYVHDCETETTQKITDRGLRTRSFPEDFLWGADGQRLYYICTRGRGDFDGPFDLQQVALDTDAAATTIFSDDEFFVLEDTHPTRDELLLSYRRGRSQLYRLTLSTGDCERVSDLLLIRGARYSPDGEWIAINTAYAEDAPNEQLHLAISSAAGDPHIDGLDSGPVNCISWHPSKPQLLIAAADEREQFGLYDVPTDDLRWCQTDVPQCQPIDFLPSGERILALCDGTPYLYPVDENATASSIPGEQLSTVDAATVTANSLVFQHHDADNNAILTQYTSATDTQTTALTSEPGPGATYRSLITDVAKDLARTPRIDDDNRMAVGSVHPAEREALSPLLTNGFEIIGTGLGRLVLRFPQSSPVADYVLKLARFGDTPLYAGAIQNQWEVAVWERCTSPAEVPLLPIVNYQELSHRWLIVPYGEPITDDPLHQQLDVVAQLQTELADVPDLNAFDIHRNNIIRYDDEYYLADYGRLPMH